MEVFVTDISAFELWFTDQPVIRVANPLQTVPQYQQTALSKGGVPWDELDRLGLRRPIHLAVPNPSKRRSSCNVICHVFRNPPASSFVRLSRNVYAEAPIPTLIKAAPRLPTGTLMQLIYQMLGTYQIKQGAIAQRRPLASLDQLVSYVQNSYRIKGLEAVRTLLPYAIENVGSPEEAQLATLLFLPERYGGQSLPLAEANARIKTSESALVRTRFADLLWKPWKLILEYDSNQFHTGEDKIGHDSARRTQLQADGYHVVSMTRHQLHDPSEFRDVIHTIRRFMGDAASHTHEPSRRTFTQPEIELRHSLYRFDIARAVGL